MYCLISALSTKAKSTVSEMLDVVKMSTFGCLKYTLVYTNSFLNLKITSFMYLNHLIQEMFKVDI